MTDDDLTTVELDRLRWAEVLIALIKAMKDDRPSDRARERWSEAFEQIKEQTTITGTDLVELQETVYKRHE